MLRPELYVEQDSCVVALAPAPLSSLHIVTDCHTPNQTMALAMVAWARC